MPDNRVKAEQVNLLYQHANVVLWGSLLMAVILVIIFWQQIPQQTLLTWLAIITVITLLRALLVHRYHSTPRKQAPHWGNRYAYTAAIAGIVWGIGYFMYFLPDKPAFVIFSACMYVGMISAATLSLTAYMPAYYSFVIPATLPVSIKTALAGGDLYLVIGLSYLLYLGVRFRLEKFPVLDN